MPLPSAPSTFATDPGRRIVVNVTLRATGYLPGPTEQGALDAESLSTLLGESLDWAGVLHGLMIGDDHMGLETLTGTGAVPNGLTVTTTLGDILIEPVAGRLTRIGDAGCYMQVQTGIETVTLRASEVGGALVLLADGGANGDASITLGRDTGRVQATGLEAAAAGQTGRRYAYPAADPRVITLDCDTCGGGWTLLSTAAAMHPLEIRQLGTGAFNLTGVTIVAPGAFAGPGTVRMVRPLPFSFRDVDADLASPTTRYELRSLSAVFNGAGGSGTGNTAVRLIAKNRNPAVAELAILSVTAAAPNSGVVAIALDLVTYSYHLEVWDNTIGTAGSGLSTDEVGHVFVELKAFEVGS